MIEIKKRNADEFIDFITNETKENRNNKEKELPINKSKGYVKDKKRKSVVKKHENI